MLGNNLVSTPLYDSQLYHILVHSELAKMGQDGQTLLVITGQSTDTSPQAYGHLEALKCA